MRWKYILLSLLAIIIIGISYIYVAHLRPIPQFQPTGDHSVGATTFDFEFQSPTSGENRKINVRAWYPSDATEGEINLVSSQRLVNKTVEYYSMPEVLAVTEPSLSFIDAPFTDGIDSAPVLIFNHGFGSFPEQSTVNMQELASNGYIVLSLAHPETSLLTEYADGTYVYNNPNNPSFAEQADYEQAGRNSLHSMTIAVAATENSDSFEEYWHAMRTLGQSAPFANMQPILREWVEDTSALIDALAADQTEQIPAKLASRINPQLIGVFGHSLGGMTAVATSMLNDNVSAAINLDGPFIFDEPIENISLTAPTCMLMADEFSVGGETLNTSNLNTPLFETSTQGGCVAIFKGAGHMNFSDLNYVPFLRLIKVLGPVNQEKFGIEQNHLLVSFFDRHLKGDETPYVPVYDDRVEYREF